MDRRLAGGHGREVHYERLHRGESGVGLVLGFVGESRVDGGATATDESAHSGPGRLANDGEGALNTWRGRGESVLGSWVNSCGTRVGIRRGGDPYAYPKILVVTYHPTSARRAGSRG